MSNRKISEVSDLLSNAVSHMTELRNVMNQVRTLCKDARLPEEKNPHVEDVVDHAAATLLTNALILANIILDDLGRPRVYEKNLVDLLLDLSTLLGNMETLNAIDTASRLDDDDIDATFADLTKGLDL